MNGESSMAKEIQDDLETPACQPIPEMVVRINDWIKSQAPVALVGASGWFSAANVNSVPLRSNKVGCNVPCPSGSDRKYKR
jgi:hypothetical protein